MADTQKPNTEPLTLDREDRQAQRQSTRQQWSMLAHLLHLPSFEELRNLNAQQRQVAQRVADMIAAVRGQAQQRDQIRDLLVTEFQHERGTDTGISTPPPAANVLPDEQFAIADAWLKAIYNNVTETDVRQMITQLPANIRPIENPRYWHATHVQINGADREIWIDLQHPDWATGTRQQIQQRLANRAPASVGIRTDPPVPVTYRLDAPSIQNILNSRAGVVDPEMPIRTFEFQDVPAAGQRIMVDLPGLIRNNSQVAGMDQTTMNAYFAGAGAAQLIEYVHVYGPGGAVVNVVPAMAPGIVNRVFLELSRSPSQPLCRRRSLLSEALDTRAPLQRLVTSASNNRDLMLALTTLQSDPSAGTALQKASVEVNTLNTQVTENETLLNTAIAVKEMKSMQAPPLNQDQMNHGISAMRRVMQIASGGAGTVNGTVINLRDGMAQPPTPPPPPPPAPPFPAPPPVSVGPALTPDEIAEADRAAVSSTLTRIVVTNNKGEIQRDNNEAFQKVVEQAQKIIEKYEEELRKINNIVNALTTMGNILADREVRDITAYPLLIRFFAWTGGTPPARPTFAINVGAVDVTFNGTALEREFKSALLLGNPSRGLNLQDVENYETKKKDLMEQLEKATEKAKEGRGPDDCWEVVQQGLQNRGVRGEELDNTMKYMRTRAELTPQSMRDVQTLSEAAFPYLPPEGEENDDVVSDWNGDRSFRRANRLWLSRYNAWDEYRNRLFTRENIGMTWGENIESTRELTIPRLTDIYFRMKYLLDLPSDDPRRLPHSREVLDRMRRLHATILRRAQENFRVASGMSDEDMQQLRAKGMEVDVQNVPKMTVAERLQAVHSFLLTGGQAYVERNKDTIDKITRSAYRSVGENVESHKAFVNGMIDYSVRNPHLSLLGTAKDMVYTPLKLLNYDLPKAGISKVWAGLKSAGEGIKARKKNIGFWGAVGFLSFGPPGAMVAGGLSSFMSDRDAAAAH